MARRIPDPIPHTESVVDWLVGHREQVSAGALVALGIVALMLVARFVGQRMVEREHMAERIGWQTVIGRVLAKTTIAFMVVTAIDIVATYAMPPARALRLVDIAFMALMNSVCSPRDSGTCADSQRIRRRPSARKKNRATIMSMKSNNAPVIDDRPAAREASPPSSTCAVSWSRSAGTFRTTSSPMGASQPGKRSTNPMGPSVAKMDLTQAAASFTCFRGSRAAAQLKWHRQHEDDVRVPRFPRLSGRGSIEVTETPS